METEKNMPDLEQAVYEVIRYFMDWGLWHEILIKCGGKVYTDVKTAELFTADESEIYYGCEKETGFRELGDVSVIVAPDDPEDADGKAAEPDENACSRDGKEKRKPVMTVVLNTEAAGLFGYGEYIVCYGKLSTESKRFLLANTWIGEDIEMDMYMETDKLRGQDWIAQDYDSFEEWAHTHDILGDPVPEFFPDGPPLDLEHPEIYDNWLINDRNGNHTLKDGIFRFWVAGEDQVVSHVLDVFMEFLLKHDLEYGLEMEGKMLLYCVDDL